MSMPADDRGLLLGDGLFETVLFREGEPVLWDAPMDRLRRGCWVLGLPAPDAAAVRAEALQALHAANLGGARAAVRVTWTAGLGGRGLDRPESVTPRLVVTAAASPRPATAATAMKASVRRNAGSPASRLKTLSYLDNVLARREAREGGADEAILLNTDGHLASAAAANLFWVCEGRLLTPALECGVLDGVMRGAVMAAAGRLAVPVEEVVAPSGALDGAEGLFLTNSLIGVRPVAILDGRSCTGHRLVDAVSEAVAPLA